VTSTAYTDPRFQRASRAQDPPRVASIRSENVELILSQTVVVVLLIRAASDRILLEFFNTDFGGSSITFGAAINALVIAVAALFVFRRPSSVPFAVFWTWAPYLCVTLIAALYAPDVNIAARMFLVTLSYWSMFALPFFMFRSRADLLRFILLTFASSIIPSLYSFLDIWHGMSNWHEFRLQSTFPHPNIYALYLVLLIGLALYVRASPAEFWPRRVRSWITWYIPVLLVFLVLTKARTSWAACALMFLIYAVWLDRRLLMGLVILPLLLSPTSIVGDRLADLLQAQEVEDLKELNADKRLNSYAWRVALWQSAIPAIAQRPLFGYGLESFRPSTPKFFPLIGPWGIDAHNVYLQIVFEMGAIGLLAYTWLMGSLMWWLKQGLRFDPRGFVVVLTFPLAYLLASYSENMVYYLSFNWYFMFVMGTFCAWISTSFAEIKAGHPGDWKDRSAAFAEGRIKRSTAG
jgi:putative inorganic carbon (hco3(-)) transporter